MTDAVGRRIVGWLPGVHLNEQGHEQALAVGKALKARYKLDAVVSSPLDRAKETARAIAERQDLDVQTDDALNELDVGDWLGKPFDELQPCEEWGRFNELRSIRRAPGGEAEAHDLCRPDRAPEGARPHDDLSSEPRPRGGPCGARRPAAAR